MKLLLWLIACVNLVVGKQILSTLPCHDYCYKREHPCLDCYKKCMQQSSKLECYEPMQKNPPVIDSTTTKEIGELKQLPCHDYCYGKEWPCLDCYNKCMQHSSKLQCDQGRQNDQPKTTTQRPTTKNISAPEELNKKNITFSCDKHCYEKEHPCLDCYNKCMQQCEKKHPPKVADNLVRTTAGLPNRKNRFGWFNPA